MADICSNRESSQDRDLTAQKACGFLPAPKHGAAILQSYLCSHSEIVLFSNWWKYSRSGSPTVPCLDKMNSTLAKMFSEIITQS